MNKKHFLYLIVFSLINTINAQITTNNTTYTSAQLISEVLNGGASCVAITNVQSYTGTSVNGIAYFDKNGSNFPFGNGIVLSTGNAMNAPGPNNVVLHGQEAGWNGDTDLENFTGAVSTVNASFIEFDFIPTQNEISFRFILASENYNENNECSYTESLAFILTHIGSGVVSTNLAKLPAPSNYSDLVETQNVHPTMPLLCYENNDQYFSNYNFDANDSSVAQNSAIEYGGQTIPITAFSAVNPGDTYHLKLVIGDNYSPDFDSAVFIEGGNFNSCPTPIVPPAPTASTPSSNKEVGLYPSYADDKVFISSGLVINELRVINMLGKVVTTIKPNAKDYELDVKGLKSGIYFISTRTKGGNRVYRIVRK